LPIVGRLWTVAVTVALTRTMGITGPAVALLAGAVLDVAWKTIVLHEHLSRPLRELWTPREQLALCASCAGGFATAYVVTGALPSNAGLALGVVAAALAYIAMLAALGAINRRDRARVVELWARVGER